MQTTKSFPNRGLAAFSLIEGALAIAILTFAVIGILSVMSSGMGGYRQVMDTTVAAQIAQRVIGDAEQADYDELTNATALGSYAGASQMESEGKTFSFRAPTLEAPAFRYFDEQAKEIVPKDGVKLSTEERLAAVYWVNTRIAPHPKIPRGDGKATEVAQLTVEVACNGTGLNLNLSRYVEQNTNSPRYNLLSPPAGVRVLTYSAFVGRNE